VSESSTIGARTARRMLSRRSLGDSVRAADVAAGREPAKLHVTVCRPGPPGPASVAIVSPAPSTMRIDAGVPPAPETRYEMLAPYGGLGIAKNACALPLPLAISAGASPH
jgi:hypothetical protein